MALRFVKDTTRQESPRLKDVPKEPERDPSAGRANALSVAGRRSRRRAAGDEQQETTCGRGQAGMEIERRYCLPVRRTRLSCTGSARGRAGLGRLTCAVRNDWARRVRTVETGGLTHRVATRKRDIPGVPGGRALLGRWWHGVHIPTRVAATEGRSRSFDGVACTVRPKSGCQGAPRGRLKRARRSVRRVRPSTGLLGGTGGPGRVDPAHSGAC